MPTRFRNVERAGEQVAHLHRLLLQLENRMTSVRGSLSATITELFGSNRGALHTLQETSLAARIAEAVISQLTVLPQAPTAQKKRYLREREAAEFMGVSVSALRSWRLRRSKAGPPFTRLGKMVLYPVAEIENHMQAGLVARHK